ncbi:MAG: hypothetical protein JXB47_16465 [Anaerolineae bacterium]|nr:hypothetical protein [Anaerolineae bacterium]
MNDITEFFNSGIMPLCINMFLLTILLVVVLVWITYRRTRRESGLPPQPGIFARLWSAIVNFVMTEEPDKDKGKAKDTETDAVDISGPVNIPQEAALDWLQTDAVPGPPPIETLTEQLAALADAEAHPMNMIEEPQDLEQPSPEMLDGSDDVPAEEEPAAPDAEPVTVEAVAERPGAVRAAETPEVEAAAEVPVSEAGAPADAVEVLRVWRDLADGSLIIDFGHRRYRDLRQLTDPDLRRRFAGVLRSLMQMAQVLAPPARQTAPTPPSASSYVPPDVSGLKQSVQATKEKPGAPGEKSPHMLRQIGRVMIGQRPTPGPAPSEQSAPTIAEQIDDFLQYKLQHSPQFAGRSIHIRPNIAGGVTIVVDDKAYEGVGDVEDLEVRQLIQSAIQEWEARQ